MIIGIALQGLGECYHLCSLVKEIVEIDGCVMIRRDLVINEASPIAV